MTTKDRYHLLRAFGYKRWVSALFALPDWALYTLCALWVVLFTYTLAKLVF